MTAWQAAGLPVEPGSAPASPPPPTAGPVPEVGTFAGLATVVSGLGFKPTYMALSLALIVFLWRAEDRDLVLIRRGLVAFLAGESFCALNYLLADGGDLLLDMLHGLGMVGLGTLVPWGLFALLDDRVLGATSSRAACSLRGLCSSCSKSEDVPCLLQRVLAVVAPALALVSLAPWTAPLRGQYQVHDVFSTPVLFSYSLGLQLADFRCFPVMACASFLLATVLLHSGRGAVTRAQLPFFAGLGLSLYSLFRFLLLEAFRVVPHWSDFWEEATELAVIAVLGYVLLLWRRRLGLPSLPGDER